MIIKQHCIFYGIQINHFENNDTWSKILMKLISTIKYDINLKDWDMDCIKDIKNI